MPRVAARLVLAATAVAVVLGIVPLTANARAAAGAEVVRKGPPWISIEYPANPHDPASRGAVLVVNTFHHGTPTDFTITGKAEGMVNGVRK